MSRAASEVHRRQQLGPNWTQTGQCHVIGECSKLTPIDRGGIRTEEVTNSWRQNGTLWHTIRNITERRFGPTDTNFRNEFIIWTKKILQSLRMSLSRSASCHTESVSTSKRSIPVDSPCALLFLTCLTTLLMRS
jgi:hypothetical protein